jgi:hypothetical protein
MILNRNLSLDEILKIHGQHVYHNDHVSDKSTLTCKQVFPEYSKDMKLMSYSKTVQINILKKMIVLNSRVS